MQPAYLQTSLRISARKAIAQAELPPYFKGGGEGRRTAPLSEFRAENCPPQNSYCASTLGVVVVVVFIECTRIKDVLIQETPRSRGDPGTYEESTSDLWITTDPLQPSTLGYMRLSYIMVNKHTYNT
ncbi:hypothetical protein DPMN_166832 [Dreissena polymorpha]|uniref:Uncharacterized protein n=1 Tax=Dreissena polymorpha TaxID=45954 RepID=A0A9D4F2T4_DREPO|nr:hypothetical protein DPMN_166832 [Dreissena polymorpha]